ncbi:glycosyltransferase family 2 protein [bacterium]|nr:glycosyltransferase family 2 protein [bacterium]
MPKISVITASYNYENYIKETIESVINQTFQDWEMIIVDDGSKNNSVEVIKSYCEKDNRIKFFQHEHGVNKGLAETIKLGIEKSTGDWIVFLESDDTIVPDYLETKLKIIEENQDVKFIFNDINMFGEQNIIEKYDSYFKKQKKILSKLNFPTKMLKAFKSTHTNLIPTFSCVMVKKISCKNLNFNCPIKKGLDLYLWLQLLRTNDFYYIDKKLTNWRMHKSSYMNSEKINDYDSLKYDFKRIYYLWGPFAILRYLLLFINFLRKNFIKIRISKNKKEIIILGYKF